MLLMEMNGLYHKYFICLLILVCFRNAPARLIDNVNQAIVENLREEIVSLTNDTNVEVETLLDIFSQYSTGSGETGADDLKEACAASINISICREYILKQCLNMEELRRYSIVDNKNQTLVDWFPPLLYNIHNKACAQREPLPEAREHRKRKKPSTGQAWGYGIGFVTLICCVSNVGGFMAPFMKKNFFQKMLMFCVALAVGTLAATGFLVLIPESMHLTTEDSPVPDYHHKMATVMGGVYFFYISERLLKMWFSRPKKRTKKGENIAQKTDPVTENNHTPSHFPDVFGTPEISENLIKHPPDDTPVSQKVKRKHKLTTVALMILIGDALHNFVDGIAIGAAFTENTYLGISVSLSVVCEELPHELGDIAILLNSGLNMRRSLCYNFMAALTCYIGLVVGILLGENTDANMWIFAVAGGMFVYLSLVDMIPEMTAQIQCVEESETESKLVALIIQNVGLLTGFIIIMMLVLYGGNIEV